MPRIPAQGFKLVFCQWATFVSEALLFAAAKTIYKYRAGRDDDLGQLQDLKSDLTEFSNSPTTIKSPGKAKSPTEGGRRDTRKRKGSRAERRQIPASFDC